MINNTNENTFSNAFSLASAQQGDFLFYYRENDVLIKKEENGAFSLPVYGEFTPKCHHIFSIDGKNCYLAEETVDAPSGYAYVNVRALMNSSSTEKLFLILTTGLQLCRWEKSRKFCGACGTPTVRSKKERAMICPKCGQTEYPKICPATITAVTHNGKLLMARHTKSPARGYGLIAGFCEIGETFEENVKRETMEEVGIKVKNITYYKNQPWGITDSHMIGFLAELDGEEETLLLQEEEIIEARWFAPEEIQPPVNNFSLYSELVWKFLTEHGIKRDNI